ncbi:MAG TPA: HAD family phosphatase [Candidatus Limnocylindria bacterium]|nr:HAD family phosphatase [Candidatus Limnocylindria bacterium]
MNKAFLFDLDGVLIADEQIWDDKKQIIFRELFGEKIQGKLGNTSGINMDAIYEMAVQLGATSDKQTLVDALHKAAEGIYKTAPIPEGLDKLVAVLKDLNYRIGIVSSSPMTWVTTVTKRLPFEDDIELIISLYEQPDLAQKPAPDGYLAAMKSLQASPASTIILEDSNAGIQSAKASGAFTIGLRQNLAKGYRQEGADVYANTMIEVASLAAHQII